MRIWSLPSAEDDTDDNAARALPPPAPRARALRRPPPTPEMLAFVPSTPVAAPRMRVPTPMTGVSTPMPPSALDYAGPAFVPPSSSPQRVEPTSHIRLKAAPRILLAASDD